MGFSQEPRQIPGKHCWAGFVRDTMLEASILLKLVSLNNALS